MTLRIPLSPDQTLQTEFHEIERRLRKLEKATGTASSSTVRIIQSGGGGTTTVNLTPILGRLDALEAVVAGLPDTVNDFGGVGETSDHGLVPAPGTSLPPTGLAEHLLTESGTWGFPFRGLMVVTTHGTEVNGGDAMSVLGSFGVLGDFSAEDVNCREVKSINGVSLEGDSYQLRSDLRGLVLIVTEAGQIELASDVVNINAGLHVHSIQAAALEVGDVHVYGELDLDGGVP